eukprot:383874_1
MALTQEEEQYDYGKRYIEYQNFLLEVKIICESDYPPLVLKLSTKLSDKKLLEIGTINLDESILDIDEEDIINSFRFIGEGSNDGQQYGANSCICGHDIKNVYHIEEIYTKEKVIVGCKCVERFYKSQWEEYVNKMKKKKSEKKKKGIIFKCMDCNINVVDGHYCICDDCS